MCSESPFRDCFMSRQDGRGSGISLTILLCKPCGGLGVNLRQAQNVSFFHCLARCTLSHRSRTHTNRSTGTATHTQLLGPPTVCAGGGRKVGELIFLLREIDVICSALHCLRTIWANSLFSADLPVYVCVCVRARVYVCVSQQQAVSIKERNCSIILATATNQSAHLCPSQLSKRTWTNSTASTRGTGCLFVRCISPAEWIDPFTSTDKGMKGNKMCILYLLIHLSCPFMQFTRAMSGGNSNTLTLTMYLHGW